LKINKLEQVIIADEDSLEAVREKELQIFRRRVRTYGLKGYAANRGLRNKFKIKDAE